MRVAASLLFAVIVLGLYIGAPIAMATLGGLLIAKGYGITGSLIVLSAVFIVAGNELREIRRSL